MDEITRRQEIKKWLNNYAQYGKKFDPLQSSAYEILKDLVEE